MKTIPITKAALARAIARWEAECRTNPEAFRPQDESATLPPEQVGEEAAEYLFPVLLAQAAA